MFQANAGRKASRALARLTSTASDLAASRSMRSIAGSQP